MPIVNQTYAFVTNQGWENSLYEVWPFAPLYGDYRLLVFAGKELPSIEKEYSSATFKYLSVEDTIKAMKSKQIGPFICNIQQAREVTPHFEIQKEIE